MAFVFSSEFRGVIQLNLIRVLAQISLPAMKIPITSLNNDKWNN